MSTATVVHAAAELRVNPPVLRVCSGTTITVRIQGPKNERPRRVTLAAKSGNPGDPNFPDGGSADGSDITLTVPAPQRGATLPEDHEYTVEVSGVGMLDPTFRIIR